MSGLLLRRSALSSNSTATRLARLTTSAPPSPSRANFARMSSLRDFNNLDDKNGCETALEVLSFLPRCRVIICSGSPHAADAFNDYRRRGYNFELSRKQCTHRICLPLLVPAKRKNAPGLI